MAQVQEVRLVDDIDGSEAVESHEFTVDGKSYEIDLNTKHSEAFRESFAEWIPDARPVKRSAKAAGAVSRGPAGANREQNQAIREWAAGQGMAVSERGRIPGTVLDAFHAAH